MFHWKIFELLLLVKIDVLNFIGKSLTLASLLYRYHYASVSVFADLLTMSFLVYSYHYRERERGGGVRR